MADEPGTDAVSVWLRRVAPAVEVVNKMGLTTVLILIIALGVGWASGYIPLKPFEVLSAEHATIRGALLESQERDKGESSRTVGVLERLTGLIERIDRRAQLIDCARLNDPDLRKRCLE